MDRFGNKQRVGGDPFQVKVDGSSDVDAEIVDHGDGMPATEPRSGRWLVVVVVARSGWVGSRPLTGRDGARLQEPTSCGGAPASKASTSSL